MIYTAITFAPVQGFIEKSRKLRDLYGSSFILSYLAEQICRAARQHLTGSEDVTWPNDPVVSPALIDITQGIPNQILIQGETEFPYEKAHAAFHQAWQNIVLTCRDWIEQTVSRSPNIQWEFAYWQRFWQAWINHAWEFFWATGDSPNDAKEALNERKFSRAWTGINWTGESSSLSGIDGRAWPHMGKYRPNSRPQAVEDAEVREFYSQLTQQLDEASITPREFLSIPELVKRLITYEQVVNASRLEVELPLTFRDLNRLLNRSADSPDTIEDANREEAKRWTGWFQGDGDRAGDYLLDKSDDELHRFSHHMRTWGSKLQNHLPTADPPRATSRKPDQATNKKPDQYGRIIYAGGDDFLGVLYRNPPQPVLTPLECLQWFETFKSQVWSRTQEPITVSVGFVWAAPNVPQRDVLQHCREAEQSAKRAGRDRLALRILFNSGNHLEWTCPWWLLEGDFSFLPKEERPETGLLGAYSDRSQKEKRKKMEERRAVGMVVSATEQYQLRTEANWSHIYNDVAMLEARHAFQAIDVALGLIRIYFGEPYYTLLKNPDHWFNRDANSKEKTRLFSGILGDKDNYLEKNRNHPNHGQPSPTAIHQALIDWVINLAKVGFHLTDAMDLSDRPSHLQAA